MHHRINKILFLVLLIYLPAVIAGQDPYYINFDTKDGLPSSEVYAVEADPNGVLWFATDRGVCSYNGYEFKTYTTDDGLANNTTLAIWKDRQGNFWFPGIDGSLSIYDHEKFYPYKWNDELKEFVKGRWVQKMVWDKTGKIFFWMTGIGATRKFTISNDNGEITEVKFDDLQKDYSSISIENLSFIDLDGYYIPDDTWVDLELIKQDGHYLFVNFHKNPKENIDFHKIGLFIKNNSLIKEQYLDNILNIDTDSSGNIWLCTKSGVIKHTIQEFPLNPVHYFKGMTVSGFLKDIQGNFWLTTLENGVFLVPSFYLNTIIETTSIFNPAKIMVALPLENHLIFGNSKGDILFIDNNINLKKKAIPGQNSQFLFGQKCNENKAVLKNLIIEEVGHQLTFKDYLLDENYYYLWEFNRDYFLATLNIGFNVIQASSKKIIKKHYPYFPEKIISVYEAEKHLWFGTTNGLFFTDKFTFDSIFHEHQKFTLLKSRINDIKSDQRTNLWLATVGNGVIYKTRDTIFQIDARNGLSSNLINRVFVENDSTLWVASNKGLNKLIYSFRDNILSITKITSYNTTDGLLSNYINDVTKWKDHIWLATNKGINYFIPESIDHPIPPPKIILEEITVNDSTYNVSEALNLKHSQNSLYFKYTGISYRKQNDTPFYRYRLKNKNETHDWYYTNNRDIRFNDLPPGEYTFEVAAQNKFGQWSEEPVICPFTINPHFSQTIWFRVIVGLTIITIIAFLIKNRIKQIQFKAEQKRRLQEAELKTKDAELQALRNQMNPHFVFNALNSIQNFIFKNDAKKANYYLSRFSKLMRDGLQFARLKNITLEEEIIFLNTYLELEKMRFPDKFQYAIKVDSQISQRNYFIPPLLFQPILENAIKHAFKNIDYEGFLEIRFEEAVPGELLKVTIIDNGDGYNHDSVNKHTKSGNKSLGLEIIKNQIALLNTEGEDYKATFNIFNRTSIDPNLKGTQAEFIILIKFSPNDQSSRYR